MKILCDKCSKPISRSKAQNDFWWACMTILGNHIGYSKEQMSVIVKDHYHWYEDFINKDTGKPHRIHESSKDWSKKEFSVNTELLLIYAAEAGCVIPSPEEYYAGVGV